MSNDEAKIKTVNVRLPDIDDESEASARMFTPEQHVVPTDWRERAVAAMDAFITPQTALAWAYLRDDEAIVGFEETSPLRFEIFMARERQRRPTYFPDLHEAEQALLKVCRSGEVRAFASAGGAAPTEVHAEMLPAAWIGLSLIDRNGAYVAGPAPGHVAAHYHNLRFQRDGVLATWSPRIPPTIEDRPARRRGRPPKFDPVQLERVVHAFMDHHGEFSPDDPAWDSQAKLEASVVRDTGIDAAESTVRAAIASHLDNWREGRKIG